MAAGIIKPGIDKRFQKGLILKWGVAALPAGPAGEVADRAK